MRSSQFGRSKLVGYNPKYNVDQRKPRLSLAAIIVGVPIFVGIIRMYVAILRELPNIDEIENFSFKQATVITDRNGEVLYKLFDENREYVPYDQISPHFVNALIATEDQRFRDNPGVDRKGTVRAGINDLRYGKTHGGSTITQQLIKNVMLSPEKTITRKLKEIILAMKLNGYVKKGYQEKI